MGDGVGGSALMLHLLSNVFPFVCRRSDITPRKDKIHCRYPCQGSGAAYNSKGRSTVYFDLLGGGGSLQRHTESQKSGSAWVVQILVLATSVGIETPLLKF